MPVSLPVGRLLVVISACLAKLGQTADKTILLAGMTCHLPQREIAECCGLFRQT